MKGNTMSKNRQFDYDVAFSFAGEDRLVVERIAKELKDRGLKVFYDDFEKSTLWGKVLYDYLADLYSNRAKFCVIFASELGAVAVEICKVIAPSSV